MTNGLKQAGIQVLAGIDIDAKCKETYEYNNAPAKFIEANIASLEIEILEKGYVADDGSKIKIEKDDDNLLFVGCSPCQYFSIMNTDKTKSESSRNLLDDFRRFVEYFNPGFVVIENVPGILSHRDSPLNNFIDFLSEKDYFSIDRKVIKVCDYGVPQTRKRFVLIASRVKHVFLPEPSKDSTLTVRTFIGDKEKFPEINAGQRDETDFCHTAAGLSEKNLARIALTKPNGGTREGWQDTELQLPVYEKHRRNGEFGFQDIYGRMFWDKPAPTITTRFYSLSNGRFGHPEQNRALSLREGATLQTFPPDYVFKQNSVADISRIIGNAVPPELARKIGMAIQEDKTGYKANGFAGRLFEGL